MYQSNVKVKKALNELTKNMSNKDFKQIMGNKTNNKLSDGFNSIQNSTIETPKMIYDGPFAENVKKVTAKGLDGQKEISYNEAMKKCRTYFEDYNIQNITYKGEAVSDTISCYNFQLNDANKRTLYAQITKAGGNLLMFDMYEICQAKNFDTETCVEIAKKFFDKIGIKDMKEVWISENDNAVATINFAYEQDGVICYSELIKVKVCETKGMVVGMEGLSYWLNHGPRTIEKAALTEEEAKAKIAQNVEIKTSRLALIPLENGGEELCWGFSGTYDGNLYYIYVSALTGEEMDVFQVIDSKQGKLLM
jgi:germination protein YpeB